MEPLWLFSPTDNSIDLVGALIFIVVIYRSLKYTYINHLNPIGRAIYVFIAFIALLHVVQVAIQWVYGGPIDGFTFRVWDLINYLTAVLFLIEVERVHRREKEHC